MFPDRLTNIRKEYRKTQQNVADYLGITRPADFYQLDLFGKIEEKERLSAAVDHLSTKYGRTVLFHGSSLAPASQLSVRTGKIGGHYK